MQPLFKEYLDFLRATTSIDLSEGFYWSNLYTIKAFNHKGELKTFYSIDIDEDLRLSISPHNPFPKRVRLERWERTVDRHLHHLEKLEKRSLNIIEQSLTNRTPKVLVSGGKDSSVVLHLVRQIVPNAPAIYTNTTMETGDTYRYLKTIPNLTIYSPKEGFYTWREKQNIIPTHRLRVCCYVYKEQALDSYLDEDNLIIYLGMRSEESQRRKDYTHEWTSTKWRKDWKGILPIVNWTEFDVWLYTLWKGLDINPMYKKGYSRAGCAVVCPFRSKSSWILDRHFYPKLYTRWQNILIEDFVLNDRWITFNTTLSEYLKRWNGGAIKEEPSEEVVKEFATYHDLPVEVAIKYFNKQCEKCGEKIKDKDVLSMNMKYNGLNSMKYYCKKHFLEELNMSKEEWNTTLNDFRNSDCMLFKEGDEKFGDK